MLSLDPVGNTIMITGFNTDIEYNGRIYHIQTEDKGSSNPTIESLLYVGGEILASRSTPYADLLAAGIDEKELAEKVQIQHRRMIIDVRQGKYDPEGVKPFGAGIISDRGFEEVVLDYLSQELAAEGLQMVIESPSEFVGGTEEELRVKVRGDLSGRAVSGVEIGVELVTTKGPPQSLATASTGEMGEMRAKILLPKIKSGGVVILRASQGTRLFEEKRPVRKSRRGA